MTSPDPSNTPIEDLLVPLDDADDVYDQLDTVDTDDDDSN